MVDISKEEARSIAASLINGIKTSLIISMEEKPARNVQQKSKEGGKRPSNAAYGRNGLQSTSNNFKDSCSANCMNMMLSNSINIDSGAGTRREEGKTKTIKMEDKRNTISQKDKANISFLNSKYNSSYNENKSNHVKYGKKCPKCSEINDKDANWCMECGKAILSVEVRRRESLKESPHQISPSYDCESKSFPFESNFPPNSVSFEDEYSANQSFSYNNQYPLYGSNADQFSAASFDFHNPEFDEDLHSKSRTDGEVAMFQKSGSGGRKENALHMYAFDDLLYPNFATHNPVYGYVLPSSNIVSNAAYIQPYYYHINNMPYESNQTQACQPRSKKHYKRNRNKRKEKKSSLHTATTKKEQDDECLEKNNFCVMEQDVGMLITDLPEEILLHAFSFLRTSDLAKCTRVCKLFNRVASDAALWKEIIVKKKNNLTDNVFAAISRKRPSRLTVTQCNGKMVTMEGLRQLFRSCADTLEVLDVSACSGGVLIGETVLLHVSARCKNIYKLDVSWSNVSNESVQGVSKALNRLEQLSINGCQGITDESIKAVAEKHGDSLQCLEVFGCFNISSASIYALAEHCKNLKKLNLGQCHKVNNVALTVIAQNMKHLESLDIRGCKQVRDSSLKEIITNCNKLTSLIIANCPSITDTSMITIASHLPALKCLDACGCCKITDRGMQALVKSCRSLEVLDLSSTKVTGRSVSAIGHYCRTSLTSLKLSFCSAVTDSCLHAVVSKCQHLKVLHLYGCKPIRNLYKLMEINPALKIEKESLR